jgi:hypothetical protein
MRQRYENQSVETKNNPVKIKKRAVEKPLTARI